MGPDILEKAFGFSGLKLALFKAGESTFQIPNQLLLNRVGFVSKNDRRALYGGEWQLSCRVGEAVDHGTSTQPETQTNPKFVITKLPCLPCRPRHARPAGTDHFHHS